MFERILQPRDPFEGVGARRRNLRLQVEGFVAFSLAIAACGLVAAMWIRVLAPLGPVIGSALPF